MGLSNLCQHGEWMARDSLLATIHARSPEEADRAEASLRAAIEMGEAAPAALPLVYEKVEK